MTPREPSPSLGKRVQLLRTARGWSQSELASRAGVALRTIVQVERGTRTPHPTTVERLADVFRVNFWILFLGDDAYD